MIKLPACPSAELKIEGNSARQILVAPQNVELKHGALGHYAQLDDGRRIKVLSSPQAIEQEDIALRGPAKKVAAADVQFSAEELSWVTSLPAASPDEVLRRLSAAFNFTEESADRERPGLWTPQVGAIHAVLGYWTTERSEAATVVMPTGTGKTEAMMGLFAAQAPPRLLVVVPSDALRNQIAAKFEIYGVLQRIGVIEASAMRPVVGRLEHRFTSIETAEEFMSACNVVVTTPGALISPERPEVTEAVLASCSHLFFDEAHHVKAPQWRTIRDGFDGKPVLQFTATPFREDGQPLGGRQVYRYPLSVAQSHGYFAEIDYTSVVDLLAPDRALAEAAIARLRSDLADGLDHVLMARVKTIARAKALHAELYQDLAEDLKPVVVYSGMGARKREVALDSLLDRDSRIVVCVDMLGEGFDLPALKVAAIHDPHKSLGVTLQFVGRFARVAGADLGRAAVFVGRPKLDITHGLRRLYAEDADWNQLISDLSENRTGIEEVVGEFEAGFGTGADEVSIRALAPKMSAAVYRTKCEDWNPEGILSVHPEHTLLSQPLQVNLVERVAWLVVKIESAVRWGELPTVEEVTYELFVVYWDKDNGLLYINASNTTGYPNSIAKAVAGDGVELIKGPAVYRAMHGIERLIPTNVGVLDVRDRDRRFSMFAGANVAAGFTDVDAATKTQTNIFGSGFEDGERVSIGGSLKGRVWSYAAARTLKHWVDWCDQVGPKLADESISVEEIKGAFILPEELTAMPDLVPLAIEWPNEVYLNTSDAARLRFGGQSVTLAEAELQVTDFFKGGAVKFELRAEGWSVEYEVDVVDKTLSFTALGPEAEIKHGLHEWIPFSEYLAEKSSGPILLFEKDAVVVSPAILLKPDLEHPPYPVEKLVVPVWGEGMKIRKESQRRPKDLDTVQARTIQHVIGMHDWDLVLDDDSSGEVADIVAIRKDGDELAVMLIHCKFSSKDEAGGRVADLYEVCGQAQRSAATRDDVGKMLEKLIHREQQRVTKYERLGFEVGDIEVLYRLQDESIRLKPTFTIAIAQPGLSRARAADNQLQLLAATEVYVKQVAKADFMVFCSA